MQYLIPVHPDQVHPSITLAEAATRWLDACGAKMVGTDFSSITDDGETITLVASARRRFDYDSMWAAANLLAEALYQGNLQAFVQDPGNSQYYRLPPGYWQEIDVVARAGDCGEFVTKEEAEVPDSLLGQRILLESEPVARWFADKLDLLRSKLEPFVLTKPVPRGELSLDGVDADTGQEVVVRIAKAKAVNECRIWLQHAYRDGAQGFLTKGAAWAEAQTKWPTDLTFRQFDTTWRSLSAANEKMSKPGRKAAGKL